MKRRYLVPAIQVNETQAATMMAVSIQGANADSSKEVLTKENNDWDIWDE